MRIPLTVLFASAVLVADAQCSQTSAGIGTPTDLTYWVDGTLCSDDGNVSLFRPQDQLGDLMVVRTDATGATVWSKRFATTDLMVKLEPGRIMVMPDGGVAVSGFRYAYQNTSTLSYMNYFILRLDATGKIEWARIYMRSGIDQAADHNAPCSALADGGFLFSTPDPMGLVATRIGPDGIPVWSKRYDMDGVGEFALPVFQANAEAADGDLLIAGGGAGEEGTTVVRLNASGDVEWARRFPTGAHTHPDAIIGTADDGVVLATSDAYDPSRMLNVMRLASDGTFGWMRHYDPVKTGKGLCELPNAELLLTQPFNGELDVLHMDADGAPMGGWDGGATALASILGLDGDTVVIGSSSHIENNLSAPRITRYDSVDDLGCDQVPISVTDVQDAAPVPSSSTATSTPVVMRSWPMSFGPALELDQVDMAVYFSKGACRPGFTSTYCANTVNQGGITSGPSNVVLTYDPMLIINSATPAPTSMVPGTITWADQPPLGMNDLHQYLVTVTVPVGTPLGTMLDASFSVAQDSVETTLANNTLMRSDEVIGSYDPNDKLVWPRTYFVLGTDSMLDYTIRFQNTGTDTAFTVVVRDTLPVDVDPTTFRPGTSTHPYTYSLTASGLLEFRFENILLADSNTNEPLSHGLVNFHIDPIWPLVPGQVITNRADIFFDLNEPVRTPDATVTVATPTGTRTVASPERLAVFPVPAKEQLTAMLPTDFVPVNGYALATDGRRIPLAVPPAHNGRIMMDVRSLPPGYYVLGLFDAKGRRNAIRFVKE